MSVRPTAAGASAYSDLGFDPTVKKYSVLLSNSSNVGKAWTKALSATTRYWGHEVSDLFEQGLELDDDVHALFNNKTEVFNIKRGTELTKATVDGIVGSWEPKIRALKAETQQLFRDGLIIDGRFQKMMGVLSDLETIEGQIKGLSALFDRYPDTKKVIVDLWAS
jgi:hypothetical protein